MEYKRIIRNIPVCLECGDKIKYGRTDKKFCSEDCKNRHHNKQSKGSRAFRRKVLGQIDRNYEILDSLVLAGIDAIDTTDILALGFVPDMFTSFRRLRSHFEYCCFDIKYIMTPSRISSISKIRNVSLSLQIGTDMNTNKY